MKDESINHAHAQAPARVTAAKLAPRQRVWAMGPLPDWCNVGVTLRVLVGVNLLFAGDAAVRADSFRQFADACLGMAVTVEPVLFSSLLIGCFLRRYALRLPDLVQVTLTLCVPALLTFAFETALAPLISLDERRILLHALFATVLCAGVIYWAHLRYQAYLPALAQARMQALQSRIRPHFLFNSINAVLGLMRSEPRRAETALEDLADLFRVLMRDERERVTLREELSLCRQYLAIEELRLGDRLQVEWDVDPDVAEGLVPSLLLQPLVENAVHHGIEPAVAAGRIVIAAKRVSAGIEIRITSPWLGENPDPARRGNRIGLENVRQRLALLHDLEARLDIAVRDGCFEVLVILPYQNA